MLFGYILGFTPKENNSVSRVRRLLHRNREVKREIGAHKPTQTGNFSVQNLV